MDKRPCPLTESTRIGDAGARCNSPGVLAHATLLNVEHCGGIGKLPLIRLFPTRSPPATQALRSISLASAARFSSSHFKIRAFWLTVERVYPGSCSYLCRAFYRLGACLSTRSLLGLVGHCPARGHWSAASRRDDYWDESVRRLRFGVCSLLHSSVKALLRRSIRRADS